MLEKTLLQKLQDEATITEVKKIQERLAPLVAIAHSAYLLFGEDEQKTLAWLMESNKIFFDLSPFQMALVGKSDVVMTKLKEWGGKGG